MRLHAWLERMGKKIALAACIAAASAILVVNEIGYRELMRQEHWATESVAARTRLHTLSARLTEAEAGQRSYLLTYRREHLRSCEEAIPAIHALLEQLRGYYAQHSDEEAARNFTLLVSAIGAKLGEIEMTIELHERGRPERALEIVDSAVGRESLPQARALVEDLSRREEAAAGALVGAWDDRLTVLRACIAMLVLLEILLVSAVFLGRALREPGARYLNNRASRLGALVSRLQEAAERERTSLARELHDELGALLTVAKMDIEWVRRRLGPDSDRLQGKLANVTHLLDQSIVSKRRIVEGLRPSALATFGLSTAARECSRQIAERAGWKLELDLPDADPELPEDVEIALFRVLQESLTNAAKHAAASRVRVSLVAKSSCCWLQVEDNGRGFRRRNVRPNAHGLFGMRQRITVRRGSFSIRSAPGEGTTVSVILPLPARETRAPLSPQGDNAIVANHAAQVARA